MATKTKKATKNKNSKALKAAIHDVVTSDLNERQKLFCLLYTTDALCFGNATRSYITAYDLRTDKQKKSARQLGYQLLTNNYIKVHIDKMRKAVFTDKGVDNIIAETMQQRKDLHARMSAVKEYNKLAKRVDGDEKPPPPVIINIGPQLARVYGNGDRGATPA